MEAIRVGVAGGDDAVILHRGLIHGARFLDAERHRLLDHDVLPMLEGVDRVGSVEAVGRGDPDGVQVGVSAERLDAVEDFGLGVLRLKALPCDRVDVGPSVELDSWSRVHRRQDLGAPDADAHHAHANGFRRSCGHFSLPDV